MLLAKLSNSITARFLQQRQAFGTSPALRGLEEFFEKPLKEGEVRTAGKSWKARDLRNKSWDDLHKLWYVLLKERNLLQSEKLRLRAQAQSLPNPLRLAKVRKSMGGIKVVLSERARGTEDPATRNQLLRFINAL